MNLKLDEKGNVLLNLSDIVDELMGDADSDTCQEILEYFAWQKPMFKYVIDKLCDEYSRDNYNTSIAKYRKDFLTKIQQSQIDYYSSVIANKLEDFKRHNDKYWELYHYVSDKLSDEDRRNMPTIFTDIEFDFRNELEKIIKESFNKGLSEVKK
jgi:inhibitor of KinA sporulation pathway (predicted exonuclease)